jgi:hypothetical protein
VIEALKGGVENALVHLAIRANVNGAEIVDSLRLTVPVINRGFPKSQHAGGFIGS